MKHNNVIPNVHLRKHWQTRVKTFFNQAAQKKRRLQKRQAKAASAFPRPTELLRPVVRGQTVRYNRKLRIGRGFSLQELKAAGLGQQFARSIGIAVDHRRTNISQESLEANKRRLQAYVSKLQLFPRVAGKAKKGLVNDTTDAPKDAGQNTLPSVFGVQQPSKREKAVKLTADLKKFNAYRTVRQEKTNKKWQGIREKRAREAEKKD
ncbi:hypothetical protein PPERSA_08577 [Pseudocohnilembus persalinus]|uniref:60S ribosomal protein L13 n=1 Tax=Pseudocohnilembus persalinus TaxID=266149 RepID=A0A0V0R6S2_PSEPJ|nr:hypothetical protein PPERSA_08577 [Pseudocohnilembus persalinus]|eukprot:KRX10174.1 hypothetical protein PPERSA_08577 [Pseudocohnilembus persalinus]